MGRKQKAKAARVAGNSCAPTTEISQPGKQTEKQVGRGGDVQSVQGVQMDAELSLTPSCQALVDKGCRAKCGGISTSLDGKWCEYHTKMRGDLHKAFYEFLQEYQSTSDSTPNMALIQETLDLDWVEGFWGRLHTRIDLLDKALLCRTCFMDRLQGDDLDFKSKKYIKGLRDSRTRLQSNLRTVEDRMFILIACASEDQKSISTQLLCRIDQQQQRCVHHNVYPDSDIRAPMFPIDRQYRHELTANFQGSVIDGYLATELRRFKTDVLEKLGVQVIQPTDYEGNDHYKLVVHWDSRNERRRAHIAAAYFRRLCFIESHLFVQAHYHMRALENGRLPRITIENPHGYQLDFDKEMDPSFLCMLTFILSPDLKLSHLEILRDYLWWPAWSEIRNAAQDVYIDEDIHKMGKPPVEPWWSKPPTPASPVTYRECGDPRGAFTMLCGMLYETSYPQTHRDGMIMPFYWPHIGALIRCGQCLVSMARNSDEWSAIVQEFSIRRIPMYSRIFPQVKGDGAGRLWASDSVTDVVRGQSDPSGCYSGLACHEEYEQECQSNQALAGLDFNGRYRLDETLDISGVVMLGIVTGGPVVRPDVDDHKQRQFLESFELYPQIWFLLTPDRNPIHNDFAIDFVHRLASRAGGSDLMIRGVAMEHLEIEQAFLSVPIFHNASQRGSGRIPRWEPMYTGFDLLRLIAGLKYEPVPHRLMGSCPMIHLSCKPNNPGGVRWLLDVILETMIEANSVRTKVELEELWTKSELGRGECGLVPEEVSLSYRFGPWYNGKVGKRDAVTQTSRLEHEDWPSNTLISGLQELHTRTVEINKLQETPPHACQSHMHLPTSEATGCYSPSQETATIDCSTSVECFQASDPQAHELYNSRPFSDAETKRTGQLSNPELYLDDHNEHPSRPEREIFSKFAPLSKNRVQAAHIDWFELMMSEDGNELPDLSDWRVAHTGRAPLLQQVD